jgi:site-specific recombinase XerC
MEGVSGAEPSLKQKLAAIRMLFDWLVTGGILPTNPTADALGTRHVVKVGKTSVLTAQEAQALLNSIPFDNSAVTRDRSLISVIYDQRRLNIWKNFWDE